MVGPGGLLEVIILQVEEEVGEGPIKKRGWGRPPSKKRKVMLLVLHHVNLYCISLLDFQL